MPLSRLKLLSNEQASGIGVFLGTFSLPAMIFGSLSKVNLLTTNWAFWSSILLTKCIIFFATVVINGLTNWGKLIGISGLYGICTTNSNDFALALPIIESLYSTSHPDYPDYIFLILPIQLAIVNPMAIILLEISRNARKTLIADTKSGEDNICSQDSIAAVTGNRTITNNTQNSDDYTGDSAIDTEAHTINETGPKESSKWQMIYNIASGIFLNPIIIMTISGMILGTFVFKGNVPATVDNFVSTITNSYAALALFSLGLAMVGKLGAFKHSSTLIVPFMFAIVKSVLVPLVAYSITMSMGPGGNSTETSNFADFAFLYGTFPTGPMVYVFAMKYEMVPEMTASVMVVSTVVSAPVILGSGKFNS